MKGGEQSPPFSLPRVAHGQVHKIDATPERFSLANG